MNSVMRQDSYWYVDGDGGEASMKAMCVMCAKKERKGWLWEGRLGYGDYDLFCTICGNAIHIRGKDGLEAGHKDEQ